MQPDCCWWRGDEQLTDTHIRIGILGDIEQWMGF